MDVEEVIESEASGHSTVREFICALVATSVNGIRARNEWLIVKERRAVTCCAEMTSNEDVVNWRTIIFAVFDDRCGPSGAGRATPLRPDSCAAHAQRMTLFVLLLFVLLFLPFVAETKRKHRRSYTWKQALRFFCCNSSQVRTLNQFQEPGMKSFVNVLCIDCYKYSCIELWSSSLVKINERCADCRQEDNSPDLLLCRPWESLICRVLAETSRNRPAALPGFGNWKMRMRQELLQLHDHFPCRTQDHLLDCMHALQGYYRRRSIGFFEARSIVARTRILARFRGVKLWRSRNNFSNQWHILKHEDRLRSEWISCYDSSVCCCCLRLCIRGGGCGQDEKRRLGVCSAAWEL